MADSSSVIRSPTQARWIAVVAVFGAVWGAAETSLGALLRSASVPMNGALMAGIGIVIMLVARRMLSADHRRGTALAVSVVTAAMLPLSVSRGILPAMAGILAEALCLEAVLYFGRPGRLRFAIAGALAATITVVQMLTTLTVQYGPAVMQMARDKLLVKEGVGKLGLAGGTAGTVLAIIVAVLATYGFLCGLTAWSIAGQILRRLGREDAPSPL